MIFIKNFFIFISILEILPMYNVIGDLDFSYNFIFLLVFFFATYLNFSLNDLIFKKIDIDLLWKYYIVFFKVPNFLVNYIINIIKQIYIYMFYFKYRTEKLTIRLLNNAHLSKYFNIWKPLFKKTSYFGFYRSNRSKWIK